MISVFKIKKQTPKVSVIKPGSEPTNAQETSKIILSHALSEIPFASVRLLRHELPQ
jgi:hypothetical protein